MALFHHFSTIFAEDLRIRCGEWDTRSKIEPRRHQDRKVHSVLIHPMFNNVSVANDVAVLRLQRPFSLTDHINVACVPDPGVTYVKGGCFATGWGKDRWGSKGLYQVVLKQVEMDLVSNHDCQAAMRTTDLGRRFVLDDSFICAGGSEGVDTCKGDGGGPLMCPLADGSGNYVQVGIVAWGKGCGQEGLPGVYASLADAYCFIDWAQRCYGDLDYEVPEQCLGWLDAEKLALDSRADQ